MSPKDSLDFFSRRSELLHYSHAAREEGRSWVKRLSILPVSSFVFIHFLNAQSHEVAKGETRVESRAAFFTNWPPTTELQDTAGSIPLPSTLLPSTSFVPVAEKGVDAKPLRRRGLCLDDSEDEVEVESCESTRKEGEVLFERSSPRRCVSKHSNAPPEGSEKRTSPSFRLGPLPDACSERAVRLGPVPSGHALVEHNRGRNEAVRAVPDPVRGSQVIMKVLPKG